MDRFLFLLSNCNARICLICDDFGGLTRNFAGKWRKNSFNQLILRRLVYLLLGIEAGEEMQRLISQPHRPTWA